MFKIVLACTVGGSHQPVVTAVHTLKSERVVAVDIGEKRNKLKLVRLRGET